MTNYIEVHKSRPHSATGVIQWPGPGKPPWLGDGSDANLRAARVQYDGLTITKEAQP